MSDAANTVPPPSGSSPREPPAPESSPLNGAEPESGPARALTLHLLHMLETRMDAAGIALNTEVQTFSSRLQLKLVAAAAMFIAIWGGIVLLAIALPDPYRIPVLTAVVVAFIIAAVWAQLAAKRQIPSQEVGSMRWFLDGLKLDLEVLSRSLHRRPEPTSASHRSPPSDLAH
jgi:uncharacterized membrane protein YqjE